MVRQLKNSHSFLDEKYNFNLQQIGHINLHGMSSQQVAMILRQQDANVRIVVGRPTSSTSPAPLTDASVASTSKTAGR